MNTMTKCYSELIEIPDFYDRLEYLQTKSHVGESTFGSHRYLNQILYHSSEWKTVKRQIIIRDLGCDLAHPDFGIVAGHMLVHHINPITVEDIYERRRCVFDPENLITTTMKTHQAIHYGRDIKPDVLVTRTPYDTCPWRR